MDSEISDVWSPDDLFDDLDLTGADYTIKMKDDFREGVMNHHIHILTRIGHYVSYPDRHFYLMQSREIAAFVFHHKFMVDYKTQNIPYGPNIHLLHEVLEFSGGDEIWKKTHHSEFRLSLDGYMEARELFEVLTGDINGGLSTEL